MLYKFKSKAAGDVIMLEPQGAQMLGLIGRGAEAKGIIEPADMPAAVAALKAAVAHDEQPDDTSNGTQDDKDRPRSVGLRARLWPMVQMLERAQAAGEPVVWGV